MIAADHRLAAILVRRNSMAKDDMRVIMYKILKYLYGCMKIGKRPALEDMCCKSTLFQIPEEYWEQVIAELSEAGYVKGFICTMAKDGLAVTMTDSARITLAGVDFLEENGNMAKVRQFLGSAFEIVLETVLKA